MHQIPNLKSFSSVLTVVSAQSIEARYQVENKNVIVAAPTGDQQLYYLLTCILYQWFDSKSDHATWLPNSNSDSFIVSNSVSILSA